MPLAPTLALIDCNNLGQRLGVNKTNYYLYGYGALGEFNSDWNYYLPDGVNTVRQVSVASGAIILARSYTPWGEVLSQNGNASALRGYMGSLWDPTTSLIYAGSGQYYDPSSGRFLSRQSGQNGNPYLPKGVDPIGAMVGPLALVGLLAGRSKKKKLGLVMMVLIVVVASGVALAGCGTTNPTIQIPPSTTPAGNQSGPNPGGSPTNTPSSPGSPTSNPSPTETCTPTSGNPNNSGGSGPKPKPEKNWLPQTFIITHYATVIESDDFFPNENGNVPIYDPSTKNITYQQVPKWRFYVGNACSGNCGNWRVSFQGSGELTEPDSLKMSGGKKYVQTDTSPQHIPTPIRGNDYHPSASYYFVDQPSGACGSGYPLVADATIAVPKGKLYLIPGVGSVANGTFSCNDRFYIEGYGDTVFTVKDTGTFVDNNPNQGHFDIYVGAKKYNEFYSDYKQDGPPPHRVAKAP